MSSPTVIVPPFTLETASKKVQLAEGASRTEFFSGRAAHAEILESERRLR